MKSERNSKTYCIFTPRVAGIGGAQLYAYRRMNFLKNKGYRTIAIVSDDKNFLLKEKFKNFDIFVFPELGYPTFNFSIQERNAIIARIIRSLGRFISDLVIESHTLTLSIWCELIAEKTKSKHIIYPLNERTLKEWEFSPIKDFFLWKLNRVEFIGPSSYSLKMVLNEYYKEEKSYFSNIAFDPDELPEKSVPEISELVEEESFIIGTISRLSKPYIQELIDNVKKIADKYQDRKITLIVAGDDPNKSIIQTLKKKYSQEGNLKILFPGYINPLGRDFFTNVDVFVGMATAAISSISLKCATITVDPITKKSSGFFGLTSRDTMFADAALLSPLDKWIELALTQPAVLSDAKEAGFDLFRAEYLADTCLNKIEKLISISDEGNKHWSFPESYLSSKWLKYRYKLELSRFYKLLQRIYGLRKELTR